MGLNSDTSLNLNIFLWMGVAMALANLCICTGLTEPLMCHTAIGSKMKCAGLFDLFFTLNQAKLDML